MPRGSPLHRRGPPDFATPLLAAIARQRCREAAFFTGGGPPYFATPLLAAIARQGCREAAPFTGGPPRFCDTPPRRYRAAKAPRGSPLHRGVPPLLRHPSSPRSRGRGAEKQQGGPPPILRRPSSPLSRGGVPRCSPLHRGGPPVFATPLLAAIARQRRREAAFFTRGSPPRFPDPCPLRCVNKQVKQTNDMTDGLSFWFSVGAPSTLSGRRRGLRGRGPVASNTTKLRRKSRAVGGRAFHLVLAAWWTNLNAWTSARRRSAPHRGCHPTAWIQSDPKWASG